MGIQQPVNSGFGRTSEPQEVLDGIDLSGKVAIVTGGYSGIGVETVRGLAGAGATVIVPARDHAKAVGNLSDVAGDVTIMAMDLADVATVRAFAAEFDARLGSRSVRLLCAPAENVALTAQAVREVFGLSAQALPDAQAIALLLAPEHNPLMGEGLNLHTLDKLGRCLAHAHFTFAKRLSHTADSQDQRHRTTPASRPILARHYTGEPDYVTPALIATSPAAATLYHATLAATWEAIEALLAEGVAPEFALYLLPNAVHLRFTESADLGALHHKHRMRLCYNAQEEIWRASLEEAVQICDRQPELGRHLLPPCTHRLHAGVQPICPEGERYCGVRVWRLALNDYARVI